MEIKLHLVAQADGRVHPYFYYAQGIDISWWTGDANNPKEYEDLLEFKWYPGIKPWPESQWKFYYKAAAEGYWNNEPPGIEWYTNFAHISQYKIYVWVGNEWRYVGWYVNHVGMLFNIDVPLGATIDSVTLKAHMKRSPLYSESGEIWIDVYPVDWVEHVYWTDKTWDLHYAMISAHRGQHYQKMDRLAYCYVPDSTNNLTEFEFVSEPAFKEYLEDTDVAKLMFVPRAWVEEDDSVEKSCMIVYPIVEPLSTWVGKEAKLEIEWH